MIQTNATDIAEVLNRPAVDDVIATVFAYSELEIFPSDRQRLHNFFRELKDNAVLGDLLGQVIFSRGADLFPFSRTLESCLVRMQLGGLIYARNPEYDKYGMTNEARKRALQKAKQRFSPEELDKLRAAGDRMREKFA